MVKYTGLDTLLGLEIFECFSKHESCGYSKKKFVINSSLFDGSFLFGKYLVS